MTSGQRELGVAPPEPGDEMVHVAPFPLAAHAQVTALPLSLGTIAVASWVGITGTESFAALKLLLPGGAATELIVDAWNGGAPLTDSLLLLVPTLAWLGVAIVLATRMFRWEPRR